MHTAIFKQGLMPGFNVFSELMTFSWNFNWILMSIFYSSAISYLYLKRLCLGDNHNGVFLQV